jgi:Uma2 family endonuclease
MATNRRSAGNREVDYPTSDGRSTDSDVHRDLMSDLIRTLEDHCAADPMVHVTGNLLLYYEEGNKRKRVAPDVFVIRGVAKRDRDYYLLWVEGKAPDIVIELTSDTTRSEDLKKKTTLYRDVLKIPEYFLFDPLQDYLKPPMQGYRLVEGQYRPIEPVEGRLPSEVLGLHLERYDSELRLFDPATGRRLPTLRERASGINAEMLHALHEAGVEGMKARSERRRRLEAEAEVDRLRRELAALRRQGSG